MSKVKRYACFAIQWDGSRNAARECMLDAEAGPYILHSDYAALEARMFEMQNAAIDLAMKNRALEAENAEQARLLGMGGSREAALLAKVAGLEAENARLREALEAWNRAAKFYDEQCLGLYNKAHSLTQESLATPAPLEDEKKACIICGGTKKDLRFAEQGSTADDCPPCPNPDCNAGEGEL